MFQQNIPKQIANSFITISISILNIQKKKNHANVDYGLSFINIRYIHAWIYAIPTKFHRLVSINFDIYQF